MSQSISPQQTLAGSAYTKAGKIIHVTPDRDDGVVRLEIDGQIHVLNLGHVEQLQHAISRAVIWLALGASP